MTYMLVDASATVEVRDHKGLLAAWKLYGGPLTLVGSFRTLKPLTASQIRRLPSGLRDRLN